MMNSHQSAFLRRARACLGAAVIVASCTSVIVEAQSPCMDCEPHRKNQVNPAGTYYFCFEGSDPAVDRPNSFTDDERVAIKDGVYYWNTLGTAHNSNVEFVTRTGYNDCQFGDIKIVRSASQNVANRPTMATTPDGYGSILRFPTTNEYLTLDVNRWKWISAHEFGHIMDYHDAYQGGGGYLGPACQNLTIMGDSWQWQGEGKCADSFALAKRYQTPEVTYVNSPDPYMPACYSRYKVTTYYCYSGNSGWFSCGTTWQWLEYACN
jgi:hypothetical protein